MAKVIVFRPASRLAVRIAWRSEPIPLSLVLVTTNALTTMTPVANSEVARRPGVAVAVTVELTGTVAVVGKERVTVVAAGEGGTSGCRRGSGRESGAGLLKKNSMG